MSGGAWRNRTLTVSLQQPGFQVLFVPFVATPLGRPLPLFEDLKVEVNEWQFGHINSRFDSALFLSSRPDAQPPKELFQCKGWLCSTRILHKSGCTSETGTCVYGRLYLWHPSFRFLIQLSTELWSLRTSQDTPPSILDCFIAYSHRLRRTGFAGLLSLSIRRYQFFTVTARASLPLYIEASHNLQALRSSTMCILIR